MIALTNGHRFIDAEALSGKTGHTVRSEYKQPHPTHVPPPADAMIIAR